MSRWPKDNQTALIKFYGDPGIAGHGGVAENLIRVVPPFQMFYDGKPLKSVSFHKKAADALTAALTKVWDYYGRDQKTIDKLGISKTAGTYNPRKIRGSATKWSNHAYGAAIDINAEQNGFNVAGNIPLVMIAAFKSEGARWGGDYKGRKDPMHFEFCDGGEPSRTFDQWLKFYGVKQPVEVAHAFGMEFADEPETKPVASEPIDDVPDLKGDADVWNVQRRLKEMAYNPGGLDGLWGGMTAGAISGFINDRQINITPPTSPEEFKKILERLRAEIAKAEGERFTRPIAIERSSATSEELEPKLPEVKAAASAERMGFWASIAAGFSAMVTGISKFLGDAIDALNPIKEFVSDVPWPVWVTGALILSGALYYISRKSGDAKNAATQAYQEGART